MISRSLRQELVLWMVTLRRIAVGAGLAAMLVRCLLGGSLLDLVPMLAVAAIVCAYNEVGRYLVLRGRPVSLTLIVNTQVALDTLILVVLLHFGGGVANPGILFLAPLFFSYGAVLPLAQAFAHVVAAAVELVALGLGEATGMLAHHAGVFHQPGMHTHVEFVLMMAAFVTLVNALCCYLSRYLSVLMRDQEQHSRTLASERGALLLRNERATARVRALLDVAQHMSGTHTVEALLRAVCDTTVALVRVPRVEIFLWDETRGCLALAAARGLSGDVIAPDGLGYSGDVPIIARLRAGEVVQFGSGHRATGAPRQRAFAAPMLYRGAFQGALFVGYGDANADELMELVQGIARQAALALANVRVMEQQQEDAEVSRVLLGLSQGLSACLDVDALCELLVRGATEVLGVPWSVAFGFDERSASFRLEGSDGVPERVVRRLESTRLRLEDLPLMQEALSGRSVVVSEDVTSRLFGTADGWPGGAWLAIPLFRGGWAAGVLVAGLTSGQRTFSPRQLRLAEGIGHHGSIALQNARLVNDLEAADQLKSEFVSTMSHELRTPLNVIIGYTEMLREGAVGQINPAQLELVDRLGARGRELLELIEATLHVGRLEAGRDTLELTSLALRELVGALQASTAGLPRPAGVEFRWEVPGDEARRLMTDRAKVALVVRNLVSNAFKFTAEGEVVVHIETRGEVLHIEVRDSGIGISAEHLPIIFDMFRQVDGSMTRRHGGVGLGLYIVKQFVTRLGGTVDVTSEPGRGSTFHVVLPSVFSCEGLRPSPPSGEARRGPHSPLAALGRARDARGDSMTEPAS